MTAAEWVLYYIAAAAVIVAAISLIVMFDNYPITETINATYIVMVHP